MDRLLLFKSILLITLLQILVACGGPLGPFAGGKLSGTVSEDVVEDWSFAANIEAIQLETRPDAPHSVNTWIGVYDNKLYVPTSLILGDAEPDTRDWVQHVMVDPRVRLRIKNTIYPATATRVTDPALIETVKTHLLEKYAEEPTQHSHAAWLFTMTPRTP